MSMFQPYCFNSILVLKLLYRNFEQIGRIMNLIKPEKLKKGDTIGFLTLSGAVDDRKGVHRAKKYFEKKGFKVVLSKNIFVKNRYLAGSDEEKIEELHAFFKDPKINAILCVRGGYGAIRLLDKINYEIIKNYPKIFAGYSDVTALEAMIYKKTKMVTFHSPMALGDFGSENPSKTTQNGFFSVLTNVENDFIIVPDKRKSKTYFKGDAIGVLWGGNLATLASLCGTDFIPDEKFILFLEDLNEPVYKIDRMLTQLLNIEKFRENVAGIALGDFLELDSKKYFDEMLFEIGKKLQKPILSGFKITHAKDKITVPNGAKAFLSTEKKILAVEKGYLK